MESKVYSDTFVRQAIGEDVKLRTNIRSQEDGLVVRTSFAKLSEDGNVEVVNLHTLPVDKDLKYFVKKLKLLKRILEDGLWKYQEIVKDKECKRNYSKHMLERRFLEEKFTHYTSYLMMDYSRKLEIGFERIRMRLADCHRSVVFEIKEDIEETIYQWIEFIERSIRACEDWESKDKSF